MFKLFWGHKKEKKVISYMQQHIDLLYVATKTFVNFLKHKDLSLITRISCLEQEADLIQRNALSIIFKGAFFPYMRSVFYDFTEHLEHAFDKIVNATTLLGIINLESFVAKEFIEISIYNEEICGLLSSEFSLAVEGKDPEKLDEVYSKIKDLERKVDGIRGDVLTKMFCTEVSNFWEGKFLANIFDDLVTFSDDIEDASDILYLIKIS